MPESDDFEYSKGRPATQEDVNAGKAKTVDIVWEPWTVEQMSAEGAGQARYNSETGAVEWNLGETFMLEEGIHYKVDFTVWPSQEAYDLLADLNNGLKDYDALDQSVKAQIKKNGDGPSATYTLKTNKDEETGNPAGYSYKKAIMENDKVIPQGNPIPKNFPEVIPLNLRTDKIGVKKDFRNLLDSRDPTQMQLQLWGNRLYKTFTLTKDGNWESDNNYISCGLLTVNKSTGELYIYETGHDFTLKETGEDSIYWELTADTYHPMVINNELHMLSKTDATAGMSADAKYFKAGEKEYYRIGGSIYLDEGTNAVLNAINDHRSFRDLSKKVIDAADQPVDTDQLFEFKATFNESRTNDDIIFTVYDTVYKQYISDQDITNAVLTPADDQQNKTPYFKAANKTEITIKIKQGWNVRFLNLSNDTTYDIEEVLGAESAFEFVKIEGNAVKTVKNDTQGGTGAAGGTSTPVPADTHMKITSGQMKMSGTIWEPNVLYSVKYTNRKIPEETMELTILKVDKNKPAVPLKGASFQIRKLVGTNASAFETDTSFNIDSKTTGEEGTVKFENLPAGIYEIEETAQPAGYVLADFKGKAYIKVEPSGITLMKSETGKAPDSWSALSASDTDAKYLTIEAAALTVKNEPGAALPSTGGCGTYYIYLLGILLTCLAGIGLMIRRIRRA